MILARKEAEGPLGSHLWGTSGKSMSKLAKGIATELGHWEISVVGGEAELCGFPKDLLGCVPNSSVGMVGQEVLMNEEAKRGIL